MKINKIIVRIVTMLMVFSLCTTHAFASESKGYSEEYIAELERIVRESDDQELVEKTQSILLEYYFDDLNKKITEEVSSNARSTGITVRTDGEYVIVNNDAISGNLLEMLPVGTSKTETKALEFSGEWEKDSKTFRLSVSKSVSYSGSGPDSHTPIAGSIWYASHRMYIGVLFGTVVGVAYSIIDVNGKVVSTGVRTEHRNTRTTAYGLLLYETSTMFLVEHSNQRECYNFGSRDWYLTKLQSKNVKLAYEW